MESVDAVSNAILDDGYWLRTGPLVPFSFFYRRVEHYMKRTDDGEVSIDVVIPGGYPDMPETDNRVRRFKVVEQRLPGARDEYAFGYRLGRNRGLYPLDRHEHDAEVSVSPGEREDRRPMTRAELDVFRETILRELDGFREARIAIPPEKRCLQSTLNSHSHRVRAVEPNIREDLEAYYQEALAALAFPAV